MTSDGKTQALNVDQFVTFSVKALDRSFLQATKEKARKLFKAIAEGQSVEVGALTVQGDKQNPLPIKLALDHSEYKGHLTFHIFKIALDLMLNNIVTRLRAKRDLNILTNADRGELIVHLPGVVEDRGHVNMLVLGLVFAKQSAVIKLQFIDTDQFLESGHASGQDISAK